MTDRDKPIASKDMAEQGLPDTEVDGCEICKGVRGGVPGNENIMYGKTVCDYCSADIIMVERAVRDDTLQVAARIVRMKSDPFAVAGDDFIGQIAEQLESTRLTPDGRWKSEEARTLWNSAALNLTSAKTVWEMYDGNGRPRHR